MRAPIEGALGSSWWDRWIVDGLVRFVGGFLKTFSWLLRLIQTGYAQNYALVMILGVLILIGYVLWGTPREHSMDFFRQHILSIVAFWPLAGMFVLLFMNKENKTLIRWWANSWSSAGFLISLPLWFWFDREQFRPDAVRRKRPWIQTLGADFHVGIDGITLLLIMLTTFLGPLAVLSSWSAIENRMKEYYAFMLMLQTGMLGVFISLDFFMFYVFWEVMLVPMYFLIGVWGGPRRLYAAIKFSCTRWLDRFCCCLEFWRSTSCIRRSPRSIRRSPPSSGPRPRSTCSRFMRWRSICPTTFSGGCSWRFLSDLRSRFRCSRSTRGCPMRTLKRQQPVRSFWPAFC